MALVDEVEQSFSTMEQAQARKLLWKDRFTSLWAPVTIFVLVFLPYVLVIEWEPCTHLWLQPLLKKFGLLMVAYYVVLVLAHLFPSPWARLRKLRHRARENLHETSKLLRRNQEKVSEKVQSEFAQTMVNIQRSLLQNDEKLIENSLKILGKLKETHHKGLRPVSHLHSVGGFVNALLVALAVRAILIEPFKIPSGSMIPTLEIGDQIFVNKFLYGVRVPWINKIVPFQIVRSPARGDVIVFNNPVEPDKDYVKRVIGIPGDTIELKDKSVYVNGEPQTLEVLDSSFLYADEHNGIWQVRDSVLVKETLGSQPHFAMQNSYIEKPFEGPYNVPQGHVFVMGDNRDNSSDSRYGLGDERRGVQFVPYGSIKGKAMVIWFAWGYQGLFASWFGDSGLRTDRLFQPVTRCEEDPPPTRAVPQNWKPSPTEE